MSPQWLPQNIQKRLLLYVLQQLSLFSEIDLPNLEEVSLNNIHLKDVSIDPEKVGRLPGCNLRYGQVGSLELNGGVMGGVNIEANEVEIVIAPNLDIHEDLTTSVQNQIFQSTADLATSIMLDAPDLTSGNNYHRNNNVDNNQRSDNNDDDSKAEDDTDTDTDTINQDSSKPSALGGVMQRAVELALSRLQIKIKNLNIKLVSELTDLAIKVDEIVVNTVNGTRSVKVKGVRFICLKPDVNPGEEEKGDLANQESTHEIPQDEENDDDNYTEDTEDTEDTEKDSDDEYDDVVEQSLMDSMVFTHEEASSIYLSATSQSFKQSNIEIPNPHNLEKTIMFINELDLEFEGLSQVSELNVNINEVVISSNPLIPSILSIINGISRGLKLKMYQKRKQTALSMNPRKNVPSTNLDNSTSFPQYEAEDDVDEEQLFNKLHISNIIISLTSAIHPDGKFAASSNNVFINLKNFNIKQKHENLIYGGVEVFKIIQTINGVANDIFKFENDELGSDSNEPTKADIRFEKFKKISSDFKGDEFTILLSKKCNLLLSPYIISIFSKLNQELGALSKYFTGLMNNFESYKSLNDNIAVAKKKWDNQIILQTSNITINLLNNASPNEDLGINIKILPISFNYLNNGLKCQKVYFEMINHGKLIKLGEIENISLLIKLKEFQNYLISSNNEKLINMSCKNNFRVSKIEFNLGFNDFLKLSEFFNTFAKNIDSCNSKLDKLNLIQESNIMTSNTSNNSMGHIGGISGSIYNPKKLRKRILINKFNCDYRLNIDEILINLNDVPNFGNLIFKFLKFDNYRLNGDIHLIIKYFNCHRFFNNTVENIIYNFNNSDGIMILGVLKSSGGCEIKLFNFLIEYYTYWQKLLNESRDSSDHNKEENSSEMTLSKNTGDKVEHKSGSKNDIRFQFINCLIGVSPYQLSCKLLLVMSKMNSDLILGETTYLKSTIRDLDLMLIDDVQNIQNLKIPSKSFNLREILNRQGFLNIGNVNNLHIGITYNFNEEKLIEKSNNYNKLSKLDIKINFNEVNVETCGDSFYTLIQLLNDLKIPIILEDDDKFKFKLNKEINLMDGIEELDFFKTKNQSSTEIKKDKEHFEIVDDYKDLVENFDDLTIEPKQSQQPEEKEEIKMDDTYFDKLVNNESRKINPISMNINIGKLNLYLYDGYDWKETRKIIRGVVKKVEQNSDDVNHHTGGYQNDGEGNNEDGDIDDRDDDLQIIEETLFQSIHVTFPKGINPNDLTTNINKQVNEEEIESNGYKDLKLRRSKKYKMLIEMKNIEINIVLLSLRDPIKQPFSISQIKDIDDTEIINEIELTVDLLTIYDNLVNSTWNKYLSYMSSIGEKEIGKNMIKLNITTVRTPVNLNYNETVMKLSLLPIRLFIDQDTNEFLTRFFKFNDVRFNLPKIDEDIYVKKFILTNDFKFKIDYKPKKINLTGLKNGEINQLINFININGLVINLNSIKIFGVRGIDNLFLKLFEYWLPNIQNTQLINLLNGIELFKPIINISGSFKDLVYLPINNINKGTSNNDRESSNYYKIINKQSKNFLKTTSFELLKLSYKLTSGTQNLLEQGEEMLGGTGSKSRKLYNDNDNDYDYDNKIHKQRRNWSNDKKNQETLELKQEIENEEQEMKLAQSLLENSMRLNKSVRIESNMYNSNKKYSEVEPTNHHAKSYYSEYYDSGDNDEYDVDDDEVNDEIEESKLISLYSNQPKNFKQGINYSFKSINKNYKLTKVEFLNLIENFNKSENYEDSIKILIKKSPLLLIRPLIGTTEVLSKTLMGLSNEINSIDQVESKDKYK